MTHNLLLNYGLYRKMEIYVSPAFMVTLFMICCIICCILHINCFVYNPLSQSILSRLV